MIAVPISAGRSHNMDENVITVIVIIVVTELLTAMTKPPMFIVIPVTKFL